MSHEAGINVGMTCNIEKVGVSVVPSVLWWWSYVCVCESVQRQGWLMYAHTALCVGFVLRARIKRLAGNVRSLAMEWLLKHFL